MNEDKELDLETAIREVETIIKELERKDLPLDEAMFLFEKGLELINLCEEKLKQARLKVEAIIKRGEKFEFVGLETARQMFKDEDKNLR